MLRGVVKARHSRCLVSSRERDKRYRIVMVYPAVCVCVCVERYVTISCCCCFLFPSSAHVNNCIPTDWPFISTTKGADITSEKSPPKHRHIQKWMSFAVGFVENVSGVTIFGESLYNRHIYIWAKISLDLEKKKKKKSLPSQTLGKNWKSWIRVDSRRRRNWWKVEEDTERKSNQLFLPHTPTVAAESQVVSVRFTCRPSPQFLHMK